MPARVRDQRGVAMPSPVAALALGAVLLAGVVLVATDPTPAPPQTARAVTATPTPTPTPAATEPRETTAPAKRKPQVRRGEVYVEVYNNSGVSGLAGSTARRLAGAGWQVVGSDNWYGTIPSSTVYFPRRLAPAARQLARDLGLERLRPAISPMRGDRLTVILTEDFA